ncbi:MAG: hypothetical protein AAF484_07095 [Pseudomonadota bacterium]
MNGWERPNYFGPLGAPDGFDHDARSLRRGGWNATSTCDSPYDPQNARIRVDSGAEAPEISHPVAAQ